MREILFALMNKKYQLIKVFLIILFSILYQPIYDLLNHLLGNRFSRNDTLYISRIIFIILIFISIILVCLKFNLFCRKNSESLILLGTSNNQCFILFFITNYEFLFLQIYLGTMICIQHEIELVPSLCINMINAILIYTLGIIVSLKLHSKTFTFLAYILISILSMLIGTNKLTYDFIYKFIMSEELKQVIFSDSLFSILVKLFSAICLLFFTMHLYKNTDINHFLNGRRLYRLNLIGDCIHKLSKYPVYEKNYWGIYRNKDYLMWKIFSSIFFIVICYAAGSNFAIFFTAYAILLITAFYYKDIYNFERNLLLIYFLSDYSYKRLLIDFTISGFYILGDNILLILIIQCITSPINLIILPLIMIAILIISFFVNSSLFVKYPAKKYNINIFLILIQLHLPILNIFYLYRNTKQGEKNWETLTYENIQLLNYK